MNSITDRAKFTQELGFVNPYQKQDTLIQKILEETDLENYRATLDFRPNGIRFGLGRNGMSRTVFLYYPFEADDFWKSVDDLADQILEKETGLGDSLDDWLNYEGDW